MPLVNPEDLPRAHEAIKALENPPCRVELEQRTLAVEGVRWIHWEDVAIRDPQDKIVEIQAVGRDTTEKKKLEEQFLRAQRLESVGRLASGIAHDLNNILAPLLMMPYGNGLAFIRALRYTKSNVKVIATTGNLSKPEFIEDLKKRVQAFLPKPFRAAKLLDTLQRVLHSDASD